MLSNLTASTQQRTNRYPSFDGCGGNYAASDAYGSATNYSTMESTVPAVAPQAFTPYASAASIQRFQSHPSMHMHVPSMQQQQHHTMAPVPLSTTPQQSSLHVPRPTMMDLSSPLLAPLQQQSHRTQSTSPLLRQSGYAMPAVTVGHRTGYDAGEVISHHHSHEVPTAVDVSSPSLSYFMTHHSSTYGDSGEFSHSMSMPPMSPPAPALAPMPVVATPVVVAAPPKPAAATSPASMSLAAPSTYSVEVTGHHGRVQTVVSHVVLDEGTHVVFEGDRGLDMGIVMNMQLSNSKMPSGSSVPMVVRSATEDEVREWTVDLPEQAAEAALECAAVVQSMRLKMAIRGASYQLDKQKLTFFYETAEHRVDFRKLLIELFNRYRCRIWMEKYNNGTSSSSPSESSVSRQRR
ncbi:Hypothetical protein, putative [Bodo saltans]|uniref:PSP1 C-terminal domain-containing protein n=1 Tax=Bodo saltans TaxID=75058 RepID=A0A0S4JG31_BODSA|nr:Hypothetical protein, putative [Bodo saltans]|eukprot:CUG89261.1 Hypothetical protein, putative [Bodo saltans]